MKVLIIGLGAIGQRHLRNLKTLLGDKLEVVAWRTRRLPHVLTPQMTVADGDVEREFGITVFHSLEEALAQKPDFAVIANPTSAHLATALQCARAGCHLFIEKPLSHDLDDVDELITEATQQNLTTFVAYQMRFQPACQNAKQLLDSGAIGEPLAARLMFGEWLPGWHPYEDYRESYAARRDLGGGVVLTQIHDLDVALWFFGMPKKLWALGGHWSHLEVDVEDVASALLQCEYSNRALPVHIQQDYLQNPGRRELEIIGDKGTLRLDLKNTKLEITGENAQSFEYSHFERNQMFLDEMQHFLNCLHGTEKPFVGLREGAQSLHIAQAVLHSMQSGEVVTL